jgi:hypothetical protein
MFERDGRIEKRKGGVVGVGGEGTEKAHFAMLSQSKIGGPSGRAMNSKMANMMATVPSLA